MGPALEKLEVQPKLDAVQNLLDPLASVFGDGHIGGQKLTAFYSRKQMVGGTLMEFSHCLIRVASKLKWLNDIEKDMMLKHNLRRMCWIVN